MSDYQLNTAVVIMIFCRPEITAQVFAEIARAKPQKLLVIADGPRSDRPQDEEKCAAARDVIEHVDWDCEVLKNYSDVNLGCRGRISSGLDWVFDNVEEAIILEDDCVPHPSFFRFCEELLVRYRDDGRIMAVSGDNVQSGRRRTRDSYYFSRYFLCCGWAAWRRAWQHFDVEMALWPEIRDGGWLVDILGSRNIVAYWQRELDAAYEGKRDTWAYRMSLACWANSGLCIQPSANLISNIGFAIDSTHTGTRHPMANMAVEEMRFPLEHPRFVVRDVQADKLTEEILWVPSLSTRIAGKMKRLFGR